MTPTREQGLGKRNSARRRLPVAAGSPARPESSHRRPLAKVTAIPPQPHRYTDLEELPSGGNGRCWLVKNLSTGRLVFVKGLLRRLTAKRMELFEREARAHRDASNWPGGRNIVRYLGFVRSQDGQPYLLLEYLPQGSLRNLLESEGKFDPVRTCQIGIDIAEGADCIELATGGAHLDLKPDNLMMDGTTVKIGDFGTCRKFRPASRFFIRLPLLLANPLGRKGELLQSDDCWGNAPYADPRKVNDPQADVYSIGIILYQCATGRMAREGDNPLEDGWADGLPIPLKFAIEKCVGPLSTRFKTPKKLAEHLHRLYKNRGAALIAPKVAVDREPLIAANHLTDNNVLHALWPTPSLGRGIFKRLFTVASCILLAVAAIAIYHFAHTKHNEPREIPPQGIVNLVSMDQGVFHQLDELEKPIRHMVKLWRKKLDLPHRSDAAPLLQAEILTITPRIVGAVTPEEPPPPPPPPPPRPGPIVVLSDVAATFKLPTGYRVAHADNQIEKTMIAFYYDNRKEISFALGCGADTYWDLSKSKDGKTILKLLRKNVPISSYQFAVCKFKNGKWEKDPNSKWLVDGKPTTDFYFIPKADGSTVIKIGQ